MYRLVKAYAPLEGRPIASIFEEAVRLRLENRRDYEEVRLWISLELLSKHKRDYAIICDGRPIGFYDNYGDAVKK